MFSAAGKRYPAQAAPVEAVVAATENDRRTWKLRGILLRRNQVRIGDAEPRQSNTLCQLIKNCLADWSTPGASQATAPANPPLRALTLAALALPGLAHSPAQAAEGDEGSFHYGHYEEADRQLFGQRTALKPIEVESLQLNGNTTLFDRWKFSASFLQDTWAGATPVATLPLAFKGNDAVDTMTAASPKISRPNVLVDRNLTPLLTRPGNIVIGANRQLVHTMTSASPETRKQGDFKLGYEWNEAAVTVGGGLSQEPDYHSGFFNLGGRWDLNQKRTTVNLGLSYTNSDTMAQLNSSDFWNYLDKVNYQENIKIERSESQGNRIFLRGNREDWGTQLGLTQVLTKNSLIEAGFGYTRGSGYMANPYKAVEFLFIDPSQDTSGLPDGTLRGDVRAILEQRPLLRNQWTWDTRYVHYIPALDASIHLGYRYHHDDWGIDAHTFEAEWGQPLGNGWVFTPRIRYYSQSAADFYQPYFFSPQSAFSYDVHSLPRYFSSDHRLSGYGALSGGATVSKRLGQAVSLEASFEYYSHAGNLKLGSGGEGKYADFNSFLVTAGLRVDLSTPLRFGSSTESHDHHHHTHAGHTGSRAPAGVMFDHMLHEPGSTMIGYRYMWNLQDGHLLYGSDSIADATAVTLGCAPGPGRCSHRPEEMSMHMHMLDLMYAPTDWLNLMLMPQFMDMDMSLRVLEGAVPEGGHPLIRHHHSTGGVGDTGMYTLLKLWDSTDQHLHIGLGISAPTGDIGQTVKIHTHTENAGTPTELIHYGMQLGSGTWDFKPSITYTGLAERWSWGGQVSGTKRLESRNDQGYALGDIIQTTVWGGYSPLEWLTASLRGVYTVQGRIKGEYTRQHSQIGPMDFPPNYGGNFWDIGLGLNAVIPEGSFQGHRLSVEWLQPVLTDVNGYQLDRKAGLFATWSMAF
jgi:hypothetical protein